MGWGVGGLGGECKGWLIGWLISWLLMVVDGGWLIGWLIGWLGELAGFGFGTLGGLAFELFLLLVHLLGGWARELGKGKDARDRGGLVVLVGKELHVELFLALDEDVKLDPCLLGRRHGLCDLDGKRVVPVVQKVCARLDVLRTLPLVLLKQRIVDKQPELDVMRHIPHLGILSIYISRQSLTPFSLSTRPHDHTTTQPHDHTATQRHSDTATRVPAIPKS